MGVANYHATYTPKCAFEIELKWIQASGPMFGEVIQFWVRKCPNGMHLCPIPSDPFALPYKANSDPLRMPIFIPLQWECLVETKQELFHGNLLMLHRKIAINRSLSSNRSSVIAPHQKTMTKLAYCQSLILYFRLFCCYVYGISIRSVKYKFTETVVVVVVDRFIDISVQYSSTLPSLWYLPDKFCHFSALILIQGYVENIVEKWQRPVTADYAAYCISSILQKDRAKIIKMLRILQTVLSIPRCKLDLMNLRLNLQSIPRKLSTCEPFSSARLFCVVSGSCVCKKMPGESTLRRNPVSTFIQPEECL